MTPDERQALRAKHRVGQNEADDQCQACFTIPYPCDVIKVLDYAELLEQAYENARAMGARMTVLFAQSLDELKVVTTPDEETAAECDVDHDTVQGSHLEREGWTDVDTNFCPNCGVKL